MSKSKIPPADPSLNTNDVARKGEQPLDAEADFSRRIASDADKADNIDKESLPIVQAQMNQAVSADDAMAKAASVPDTSSSAFDQPAKSCAFLELDGKWAIRCNGVTVMLGAPHELATIPIKTAITMVCDAVDRTHTGDLVMAGKTA